MEVEELLPTATATLSDDDLTDAQIEDLLRQAEVKLGTKNAAQLVPSKPSGSRQQQQLTPFAPSIETKNGITRVDRESMLDDTTKSLAAVGARKVEDPIASRRRKAEEKKATAGSSWFNMPRTDLTPQLKRDLQVLRMRDVLDPKRHYRKDSARPTVPEFSQVGTLIEGPTEYFSARLSKKERKRTIVEDVLEGERDDRRFKRKYEELQTTKRSGKKAYYKDLLKKRYGKKALKK